MKSQTIEGFKLSPVQRDLWTAWRRRRDAPFRVEAVVAITGALDEDRLENTIAALVKRHGLLAARFPTLPGMDTPLQTGDGEPPILCSGEEPAQPELDPERGPVLWAGLYRSGPRRAELRLIASPLIADESSLRLLAGSLAAAYDDKESDEGEEPLHYAAVAQWMNELMASEEAAEGRAHWLRLETIEPPRFGFERDRDAASPFQPATLPPRPIASLEAVNALAERWRVAIETIGLAAWIASIHRAGGPERIVADVRFDARADEDLAAAFGPLTRWLPTAVLCRPSLTLADLAETVQDAMAESLNWLECYARPDARSPGLFYEWRNPEPCRFEANQASFDLVSVEVCDQPFAVKLSLRVERDEVVAHWAFDGAWLEDEAVAWLADRFGETLRFMLNRPDARLADLPAMSAVERRAVLAAGLGPELDVPAGPVLADLFRAQARRAPERVAVECGGARLDYAELDARSDRLAAALRMRGAGPETVVALCAEPSLELMIGVLAIFKAGAAYLPLDPSYPESRLRHYLDRSAARLLLTQRGLEGKAPQEGLIVFSLDEPNAWGQEPADAAPAAVSPHNLAYMIFTSGSTGEPKGVAVTHQALLNQCLAIIQRHRMTETDRFLTFAAINFDASLEQMLPALLCGAATVLIDRKDWQGEGVDRKIDALALTIVNFPTAFWNTLAKAWTDDNDCALPNGVLRLAIAGGERMPAESLRRWLASPLREIEMVNAYGPTEACVTATMHQADPGEAKQRRYVTPPIGAALANRRIAVLDTTGEPTPFGAVGELWLGGAGLARGYWRQPDLTAAAFGPDPFAAEPGARRYRTGDRARLLPDGAFQFAGRDDAQVKLRGYRIELTEVEWVVMAHPAIREAAAALYSEPNVPESGRLIAYYTLAPGRELIAEDLRAFLRERLPEHMVPSLFAPLEALPLTPAGKLDRASLPDPSRAAVNVAATYTAPRNETESLLAAIWQNTLHAERIGVFDNFFDLGGHSLLATQVVARIRNAFGVDFPLRLLFPKPFIAAIAEQVEDLRRKGAGLAAPPLTRQTRPERTPVSFAQLRLWLIHDLAPESSVYHVPFLLEIDGPLQPRAMARAFAEIIRRHEALRTTFAFADEEPIQIVHPFSEWRLDTVDLSGLAETDRQRLTTALAERSRLGAFDLARGPLIRIALLRLAADRHALLANMHHIVSDGWSTKVFLREFMTLYEAFEAGKPSPLPELSIQYADFAIWQRGWLRERTLERQLDFWRTEFAEPPAALDLPTHGPRPSGLTDRGAVAQVHVPAETLQAFKDMARREAATLYMALLAAYYALLFRHTGQSDITVGAPVANRSAEETEGLIGFFINTLALRARPRGDLPFCELVAACREKTLEAYAHQDLPFEQLVAELDLPRDHSRSPLFQTAFVLQNAPAGDTAIAGLSAKPLAGTSEIQAKYEITVSVHEDEDGLRGVFEYKTALFEASYVNSLIERFGILLAHFSTHPETTLDDAPLLGHADRLRVLETWSGATGAHPASRCAHQMFEARAAETPDAPALFPAEAMAPLSYGWLNAQANRLARVLRNRGAGFDGLVALCLDRSAEAVAAILAIVKAGAAYLPLDPANPPQRLAWMIQDAGAGLALCDEPLAARLGDMGLATLTADQARAEAAAQPDHNLDLDVDREHLMYAMFTSGSTGEPKGVSTPHRAAARLVHDPNFMTAATGEKTLLLAPLSFDASTLEIWMTLAHGGALCVYPPETPDLATLGAFLRERGIAVAWLTAGLFHQMAAQRQEDLAGLRVLLAGGDTLSPTHVRATLERHTSLRLVNGYGPTENTTFTCCHPMSGSVRDDRPVPIGQPIQGGRVLILGSGLQPTPPMTPGELYAAGDGLARGYLNRPAQTAERFIPNPWSSNPGERMYRTGDLARWLSDGTIDFLGRRDGQIKLRGFRVELGEIENALTRLEGVRAAAVLIKQDEAGDKSLIAFVQPESEAGLDAAALRQAMARQLPAYMIPASFALRAELPLNANGKIDRSALSLPEDERPETPYTAPRSPTEVQLAELWSASLKRERIGVHDNFFEIGGHSLNGAALVARVKQALDAPIILRDLFDAPTIAQFAQRIHERQVEHAGADEKDAMLAELSQLSPEEIQALLQEERARDAATAQKTERRIAP